MRARAGLCRCASTTEARAPFSSFPSSPIRSRRRPTTATTTTPRPRLHPASPPPLPRASPSDQERLDLEAFEPFLRPPPPAGEGDESDADAAWSLLSRFTAADFSGRAPALLADPDKREALRRALRVVAGNARPSEGWFPSVEDSRETSSSSVPPPLVVAVLASGHEIACRALRDYLDLFSLPYVPPSPRISPGSGVFVKVSASSLVRLASQEENGGEGDGTEATTTTVPLLQPPRATPYSGKDRGVLLTLGTTQFGHLPLGLLDETREKPAPEI